MRAVISILGLAAACAAPARTPEAARDRDRIAIVIAERGTTGARLVAIDERGDRRLDVVKESATEARDTNPAISPDGRWIVFASSRGRAIDETSLWIAPLQPDATPRALTTGPGVDSHPAWTRDGRAIVFASTRGGGGFDLYELAIDAGRAAGEPRQLTSTPEHEVTPTVAADGTIVYAKITPRPDGQVESHLEARAADGTITALTHGPADTSPALSPDDREIAFARPVEHKGAPDADLFVVARTGETAAQPARHLVDVPLADESGPAWSRDGRFVLATSVLRGARGNVLFSSVIVVDTHDVRPTARILMDRTGAIARLTPAVAVADLDARALDTDPEYLPELARIAAAAIAAQKQQQEAPK